MFGIVKSVIGSLFGGNNAAGNSESFVQSAAKGVGTWIDEQQFTDEEKSNLNFKTGELMLRAIEATRDENSVRSITRRVLAWAIMGSFLLLLLASAATFRLDPEYSKYLGDLATNSLLGELAIGVGAFYFLSGIARTRK